MSISLISKCVASSPTWKKILVSQFGIVTHKHLRQLYCSSASRKIFSYSCGFVRNFSTSRLALASSKKSNQEREKRKDNLLLLGIILLVLFTAFLYYLFPKTQDYVYIDEEEK